MKDNTYQYYAGNMVYKNDKSLNYILFDEGLINKSSGAYVYEYHLKDHLGNTRVAFQPNGSGTTTTQVAEYYPFGSSYLPLSPAGTNKYLYNGKEKQDDVLSSTALDEYDYGARFYDPQIGRWHVPDPFSEAFFEITPYAYVKNNSIMRLDPNGQWDVDVHAFKNRGEYGYAVLIMRDNTGSEVFRTTVRVQGASRKENNYNPRNRQAENADTPTGTYNIKGWSDRLPNKDRDMYGPNEALELDYVSGEAAGKRNNMHLHGGHQEIKQNGQWIKDKNAHLWNTYGCLRIWDDDLKNMREISQWLESSDETESPGLLKVTNDLVKKKDKKNKDIYEYEEKKETWAEAMSIILNWLRINPSIKFTSN